MVRFKCLLFEETLARVLRACFTGAIYVLLGAVVRRPRSVAWNSSDCFELFSPLNNVWIDRPLMSCRSDRDWFAFIWWHLPDRRKTPRADHTWQNPPRLNHRPPKLTLRGKSVILMIYEMNHMWTAEMKWNEEMIVAVNAIYAIA